MRAALLAWTLLGGVLPAPAFAETRNTAPAAIATPASAHSEAIPRGRLDETKVTPRAYRLDLTVDPAQERFSGKVEIDVMLGVSGMQSFYMHGRNLAVQRAYATVQGRTYSGRWTEVDATGVARLDFDRPLPAGPATLVFAYDALFGESPSGMFRVKVGDDWYSWTQFQSIDARAVFPSFDQPSFKTPFSVTLRTPPGLVAISNAAEQSRHLEGGLAVHRFAPTLPLPTYLVAMKVGPFVELAGEAPPTPQRAEPLPLRILSTRPNAGKLAFPLENTKPILARLEDYFGSGLPYPKMDQITSPIMGGAMENAGAALYADRILIVDERSPTAAKRLFGMVVAHELAHQWFGDLVTPAWWDDIWLNESFANWLGYRIGHAWRPDLNIGGGALSEGFRAMATDALLIGRPIRQKIESNSEIDAAFDSITYGKGGHVVAMIAGFMGDETFRAGVRRYLDTHRHGNATSADFFAALAEAAGDPRIIAAMQSFTDQQGVPLLTFSATDRRSGSGAQFGVSQSRYVGLGETAPAQLWNVPLCLRRGEERRCELLTQESAVLSIPGVGPLVPNAGGSGYYRFELPAAEWDRLIASAERLDGGEAQAVADSLGASIRAGRGDVARLGRLARRLSRHPDSYAADAAMQELGALVSDGLAGTAGLSGWRRFLSRVHAPLLTSYGLDLRAGAYAGEDAERSQRRQQIVAWLRASDRSTLVRDRLADAARAWLGGNVAALDPAYFRDAFGAYIESEGLPAAKILVERGLASEDPAFRPLALGAAGSSGSSQVAQWLLELDDARLRASEKRNLLRDIVLNGRTRDQGYGWLRENLDALAVGTSGIFSAQLPAMLRSFCSVDKAEEFARDLRPRLKAGPGALSLERTIEQVRNCGKLDHAKRAEITAGFARLR